jgi:hypothetical protein
MLSRKESKVTQSKSISNDDYSSIKVLAQKGSMSKSQRRRSLRNEEVYKDARKQGFHKRKWRPQMQQIQAFWIPQPMLALVFLANSINTLKLCLSPVIHR